MSPVACPVLRRALPPLKPTHNVLLRFFWGYSSVPVKSMVTVQARKLLPTLQETDEASHAPDPVRPLNLPKLCEGSTTYVTLEGVGA